MRHKLTAALAATLLLAPVATADASLKRCPKNPGKIKLDGTLHISKHKSMSCIGAALMADDLQRELTDAYPDFPGRTTVWAHGTGTADTPRQSRFRCTMRDEILNDALQVRVDADCRSASGRRWTFRMVF